MNFIGDTIRFAPIPTCPPRALLGGPFSDEAICQELYGDVCMEVEHDSTDFSVIAVNYASLKFKWRTYFEPKMEPLAENSMDGRMLLIGGLGLGNLGNQADLMRQLYNTGNEQLLAKGREMLQAGKGEEEVARWIISERNALKAAIRSQGPALFKKIAEWRNMNKYNNPLGPNYQQIKAAGKTDLAIIEGVTSTSKEFNAVGGRIRIIGRSMEAFGFILQATENSPAALEPLPKSEEEQVEIEKARLRYGISSGANIDRHGHQKPGYYLQVDMFDPHVGDETSYETEEILWWLGVDITYHYHDVIWTVPGRSW